MALVSHVVLDVVGLDPAQVALKHVAWDGLHDGEVASLVHHVALGRFRDGADAAAHGVGHRGRLEFAPI